MILINENKILNSILGLLFIVLNLGMIFLQIYKQSQFVKISYSKQRLEKERDRLIAQRNEMVHQIYIQQSNKNVKRYASDHLGMRNTGVTQIHKIE